MAKIPYQEALSAIRKQYGIPDSAPDGEILQAAYKQGIMHPGEIDMGFVPPNEPGLTPAELEPIQQTQDVITDAQKWAGSSLRQLEQTGSNMTQSPNAATRVAGVGIGTAAGTSAEWVDPTTKLGTAANLLTFFGPGIAKEAPQMLTEAGKGMQSLAAGAGEATGAISKGQAATLGTDVSKALETSPEWTHSNNITKLMNANPKGNPEAFAKTAARLEDLKNPPGEGEFPTEPNLSLKDNDVIHASNAISNMPSATFEEAHNAQRVLNNINKYEGLSKNAQQILPGIIDRLKNIKAARVAENPTAMQYLSDNGMSLDDYKMLDARTNLAQAMNNWFAPGAGQRMYQAGTQGGLASLLYKPLGAARLAGQAAAEVASSPRLMKAGLQAGEATKGLGEFLGQDVGVPDIEGSLKKALSSQAGAINPSNVQENPFMPSLASKISGSAEGAKSTLVNQNEGRYIGLQARNAPFENLHPDLQAEILDYPNAEKIMKEGGHGAVMDKMLDETADQLSPERLGKIPFNSMSQQQQIHFKNSIDRAAYRYNLLTGEQPPEHVGATQEILNYHIRPLIEGDK